VPKFMLNALLEIGCEEIPARFMPGFLEDLKKKAEEKLTAERISFGKMETLGTYRRLTLYIENIAQRQTDLSFEAKGPPANVAFDKQGKPTPAAIGFAKKQGLSLDDLKVESNYVVGRVLKKGLPTSKILQTAFPEIIVSLYQPLSMRWGSEEFKFIRPIHWVVGLLGDQVVKFAIAGVKSGDKTQGHRYKQKSRKAEKLIANISKYRKALKNLGVIVDQKERKVLIKNQVEQAARKIKQRAVIDPLLLDEVTYLVESPIAYLGRFEPSFLKIPQEVLITSMQKNQKYFPVVDQQQKLQPAFVVVTDGSHSARVVEGNQKVLSARLADAKFFFDEDRQKPFANKVTALAEIGFFEGLGSLKDKVERMSKLAEWLGKRLGLSPEEQYTALRIVLLCKADLTTKMVYDFPVLQGVMGREYALLSGEDARVANGIFEHYLPRFSGDGLPKQRESVVVALADRFDSLVGCFCLGAIPTGSTDPYGLRRAANGIIKIIQGQQLNLLLSETIEHSYKLYEPLLKGKTAKALPAVQGELLAFIAARLKQLLLDDGQRYDIVEAALSRFNDVLDVLNKTKALTACLAKAWFAGVIASADRVARLAKNATRDEVIEADLLEPAEKELNSLYLKINWSVGEAINQENWPKALEELAPLTGPIENFFNQILVMHKDERIRTNRLALLKSLDRLYRQVADLPKIILANEK